MQLKELNVDFVNLLNSSSFKFPHNCQSELLSKNDRCCPEFEISTKQYEVVSSGSSAGMKATPQE